MTSGSEPRHVAQETVEERLVEEIVEELDLHPVVEEAVGKGKGEDDEALPSISEEISRQLGGVRGLVESSLPVLAFVLFNVVLGSVADVEKRTALYWAIGGSVLTAVAIGVFRLARRQPVRHAVNGVVGIAVGAVLAWRTGRAEDFYLPGILLTAVEAVALLISMAVRRPLIGYFWGVVGNGGHQDWLSNPRLLRTFQWLTLVWVVSLAVRGGLQLYLWAQHDANALGIVRILISWPIYAATFAYSAWAIHRVTSAQKAEVTTGA